LLVKTVLFACVHDAGRTQMAAALFSRLVHPQRARVEVLLREGWAGEALSSSTTQKEGAR
jgi:protein-tyrosine-phosphatase